MKSQKVHDGHWKVTHQGKIAHLHQCHDGWEVSIWTCNGDLVSHAGIFDKRFDAKVEAEKLLMKHT